MPQNRKMELQFPAGGLDKSLSYQSQPPYSTPDAQNVRTFETFERRARGGSRGGLKAALTKHADMGGDIRFLGVVAWVDGTTRKEMPVVIEGRDLFYSTDNATFDGKVTNAVVAGTDQLYADQKQQKLYIADPGATDGTDAQIRVWDPSSPTTVADNTTTAGTIPDDCPLLTTYRDRILLAGPDHQWYGSRVCTPGDWDYACDVDDPARAISLANTDAGDIGDLITATIPHGDHSLIFGGVSTTWLMRGDPAWGGRIDNVSRDIGILTGTSWCRTPEGTVVFMTRDGLYMMPTEAQSKPESVSREVLPDELIGLDATDFITMGYSIDEASIHISRTPTSGTGEHWVFDWQTKRFWKDILPAESQPTYMAQHAGLASSQKVLLFGTRGGYILKFDDDTETDNDSAGGTAMIASYVLIGPVFPGGTDARGIVNELYAILDEDSKDVHWQILVGETAEQAVQASPSATGVWRAGRNASEHPRSGGVAIVVKVSSTKRWAMEVVVARVAHAGRALVS